MENISLPIMHFQFQAFNSLTVFAEIKSYHRSHGMNVFPKPHHHAVFSSLCPPINQASNNCVVGKCKKENVGSPGNFSFQSWHVSKQQMDVQCHYLSCANMGTVVSANKWD